MDFDHLVFEKVCFNLIKRNLFCFIYFFFLLLFFISFRFFLSFVFTGVSTILPKALGLGLELEGGGNFPRGQLSQNRFYRWKKGDFLHANEMLGFIHLQYVQSCTFLQIPNELNGVSQIMSLYFNLKYCRYGHPIKILFSFYCTVA